jgi:two-component system, NtrC family, sensor kinase
MDQNATASNVLGVVIREDLVEELRETERMTTMAKLASSIAHELGTPLNVIAGRAMMIASGEVTGDESIASAKAIVEQANRMTAVIKQILDHVRRRPGTKSMLDMKTLFARTVAVSAPRASKRRVELAIDPKSEDFTLSVDSSRFLQVMTTLVANAIDATPEGGRVVLGARRERRPPKDGPLRSTNDYFTIDVRDEGSGIEKSDLPLIFKPFQRTKPATKGTGLSLAIAQGIVREYGGWIDAESEIGVGSTFRVCLPEGGVSCQTDAS